MTEGLDDLTKFVKAVMAYRPKVKTKTKKARKISPRGKKSNLEKRT